MKLLLSSVFSHGSTATIFMMKQVARCMLSRTAFVGHCLKIFDPTGSELGMVKQRVLPCRRSSTSTAAQRRSAASKGIFSVPAPVQSRLQRLACGGQLVGLGLFHCRRQRQNSSDHQQGAFELDGHLCHWRGEPAGRPFRSDGGSCH